MWVFSREGRELKVRTQGPLVFNTIDLIIEAALAGFGLAYVPLDQVAGHIAAGRLLSVLEGWTPKLSGYHLYYPGRRLADPAFALVVEALRYRPGTQH